MIEIRVWGVEYCGQKASLVVVVVWKPGIEAWKHESETETQWKEIVTVV